MPWMILVFESMQMLSKLHRNQTKQRGMKCIKYTFAGSTQDVGTSYSWYHLYLISMFFSEHGIQKIGCLHGWHRTSPITHLGGRSDHCCARFVFFSGCEVVKKWHSQGVAGSWCFGVCSPTIDFGDPKITCGRICFKDATTTTTTTTTTTKKNMFSVLFLNQIPHLLSPAKHFSWMPHYSRLVWHSAYPWRPFQAPNGREVENIPIWLFPKIGVLPKWMVKIMENPIKMDDLGVRLFLETPIWK